jgi:hypothetical protein
MNAVEQWQAERITALHGEIRRLERREMSLRNELDRVRSELNQTIGRLRVAQQQEARR